MTAPFDGPDLLPADIDRLASQLERVKHTMRDGNWWTLRALAQRVRGSEAGVSARLRDLRKPKFGGYRVERRRLGHDALGLWQYRLHLPTAPGQLPLPWH